MPTIDVAFAVDRRNLDHVAVVVTSIRANAAPSTDVRFHILYEGDAAEVAARVSGWNLQNPPAVIALSNPYAGSVDHGRLGSASYLRLQLSEALRHLDRVIYLDADIVVHRDLAELYNADLGGAAAGGVVDMVFYGRLGREMSSGNRSLADYLISLGHAGEEPTYINSGVLVMDLARLRAMNFAAVATAAFQSRHYEYGDQCLLNNVLAGQIALLDCRWNATAQNHAHPSRWRFLPSTMRRDASLQRDSRWVTHYTGPRKPWSNALVWRAGAWWASAFKTNHPAVAAPRSNRERSLRIAGRAVSALWTARYG